MSKWNLESGNTDLEKSPRTSGGQMESDIPKNHMLTLFHLGLCTLITCKSIKNLINSDIFSIYKAWSYTGTECQNIALTLLVHVELFCWFCHIVLTDFWVK